MRLLHTSDWHLGKTLGRVDRRPDLEQVLGEIVEIATDFRPDLVVHSGDLFDHARPGASDMHLAFETLGALSRIAPVVVVAGNHDAPALFAAYQRLIDLGAGGTGLSRVTLVPWARPPADGGVLSYPASGGTQTIKLAALPFVHPNATIRYFDVEPSLLTARYTRQVRTMAEALAEGLVSDPATELGVLAAHLYVDGSTIGRSERPIHVSDTYATRAEDLPFVSYAAFGHIHKPQSLPGGRNIHYAGSPIPIDFGEVDEQKRVVLVEAAPASTPSVESVALSGGRPLRRLRGTIPALLRTDADPGRAIVDVLVDTEVPIPDLMDQLRRAWPDTTIRQATERYPQRDDGPVTIQDADREEAPVADLLRDYLAEADVPGRTADLVLRLFSDTHARLGTGEGVPPIPELEALLRCSHGEPVSGSHGEPVSGSHGEPVSGSHGEPVSGSHGEPVSGSHGEPVSGSHGEPEEAA